MQNGNTSLATIKFRSCFKDDIHMMIIGSEGYVVGAVVQFFGTNITASQSIGSFHHSYKQDSLCQRY